ncbi:TPA: oligosaccharide flippase family protein [Vibrio vulnificus]|nr:oligosaccharide flippase family protein [Vibrio vulnificus]
MRRYIGWNLIGILAPAISALIVFPILLKQVGTSTFGILVLIWSLVGVAVLLDFGIGKSITHKLSSIRDCLEEPSQYIQAAEKCSKYISIAICIFFPPVFFYYYDSIDVYYDEYDVILSSLLVTGLLIMQIYASLYRGINEAYLNFKEINIIRSFVGCVNFIGPYIVSNFSSKLFLLILPLFIARAISLFLLKSNSRKCYKKIKIESKPGLVRELLKFGGWVSVSNICVMLMMQSDRFIIGFIVGVDNIPIYAMPYELIIKIMIFSGAITSALFPILTCEAFKKESNLNKIFLKWFGLSSIIIYIFIFLIFLNVELLLMSWLGSVHELSNTIAKILIVGVAINFITSFEYCYLQAVNKVKAIGVYQIIQTPLILLLLVLLVNEFGVLGAAYTWVIRVMMDLILYSAMIFKYNLPAGEPHKENIEI